METIETHKPFVIMTDEEMKMLKFYKKLSDSDKKALRDFLKGNKKEFVREVATK